MAEAQQNVDSLKRRGRRRLVGAVALVLLAVVVLPMIFDPNPRGTPPVSVRIPAEDDTAFAPKPPAQPMLAPNAATAEKQPEATKPTEASKPSESQKPQEKKAAESKPASKKPEDRKVAPKVAENERARAEAALAGTQYVVQVGAFASPDPVVAKLAAANIRHYTEKVPTAGGNVTRVRAGPYSTKAEAERVAETLRKLGLKPGGVVAKS